MLNSERKQPFCCGNITHFEGARPKCTSLIELGQLVRFVNSTKDLLEFKPNIETIPAQIKSPSYIRNDPNMIRLVSMDIDGPMIGTRYFSTRKGMSTHKFPESIHWEFQTETSLNGQFLFNICRTSKNELVAQTRFGLFQRIGDVERTYFCDVHHMVFELDMWQPVSSIRSSDIAARARYTDAIRNTTGHALQPREFLKDFDRSNTVTRSGSFAQRVERDSEVNTDSGDHMGMRQEVRTSEAIRPNMERIGIVQMYLSNKLIRNTFTIGPEYLTEVHTANPMSTNHQGVMDQIEDILDITEA